MSFENTVTALSSFNPEQLREIKARCTMLLSGAPAGKAEAPPSDIDELCLGMLCLWARDRGFDQSSYTMMRKLNEYGEFAKKATIVMTELQQSCHNRAELTALARASFHMLYEDCIQRGPCTIRTLMRQIHRIPSVIDACFPQYRQMGALRLLLSGRMETKQGRELRDAWR